MKKGGLRLDELKCDICGYVVPGIAQTKLDLLDLASEHIKACHETESETANYSYFKYWIGDVLHVGRVEEDGKIHWRAQ